MTDKHLTSTCSDLSDTLATLRSHGVASATFNADGSLLRVDFAPAPLDIPEGDADTEAAIKTVVDQSLAMLAGRGQPKREKSE